MRQRVLSLVGMIPLSLVTAELLKGGQAVVYMRGSHLFRGELKTG